MLYHIYFSPTGGTKKVGDILAAAFATEVVEIDLLPMDADYGQFSFGKEDLCLISVPSFGGRVPQTALSRLMQMKADGTNAILTAVFGNRAIDDTLLELGDSLTALGFHPIAAVSAVAEHSIMHQFGAGRPDAEDRRTLLSFGQAIKARLATSAPLPAVSLPGNTPYLEYHSLPLVPNGNNDCTLCGACATHCPVGAISEDSPSVTDPHRCICCMGCISVCPKNARALNPAILAAAVQKLQDVCGGRKENTLFLP